MPGGKPVYNVKQYGQGSTKKPLKYGVDVLEGKGFELGKGNVLKVDREKMNAAMTVMFPAFARMTAYTMQ